MARLPAFDAAATADVREGILLFELEPLPAFESLRDRLEIGFPSQRAWLRSAATSRFPIVAIHPEFVLAPLLPRWDAIILSTAEIEALPPSWRAAISQWRGIYCTPGPPSTRPASPGSKPQAA